MPPSLASRAGAEVEADLTTGGVKLNFTTAHDTGTVFNHLTLTGR
jgi:hypothetical protein